MRLDLFLSKEEIESLGWISGYEYLKSKVLNFHLGEDYGEGSFEYHLRYNQETLETEVCKFISKASQGGDYFDNLFHGFITKKEDLVKIMVLTRTGLLKYGN